MQVPRLLILLGCLSLISLGACAPIDALNATVPLQGVEVVRDVAYMAGPRGSMDVYRPKRAERGAGRLSLRRGRACAARHGGGGAGLPAVPGGALPRLPAGWRPGDG